MSEQNETPRRETRTISAEVPFEAQGQKAVMRFTMTEKRGADFMVPRKRKVFSGVNKDTLESMYEMVDDIEIANGEVERTMTVDFEGEILPGKQIAKTVETLVTGYVLESTPEEFEEKLVRIDKVMARLKVWAKDLTDAGLVIQAGVIDGGNKAMYDAHCRARAQLKFDEEVNAHGKSTQPQASAAPAA